MDKEKFEIWVMDYLSGELSEDNNVEFENFLGSHPEYQKQFNELSNTWDQMYISEIPEPTEKMDVKFYEMLSSHQEENKKVNVLQNIKIQLASMLSKIIQPQLAFGAFLLMIGLGIGYYMNSSESLKTNIVSNTEIEEVREKLVLTLLEQPSANKRLQGVSEANKFQKAEESVMKALLQTLNNDPNVNVRLAAIESLTQFVGEPMVREGLVLSIVQQESPIVQVTLANLMVALQEKKSIEPFKKLIRQKELNKSVKQKLETSIQSII